MKIKRLAVHSYRGIEERDVEIGASGAIAKGRNGGGKTTLLRAIKAALLAQDIGPDAIRKGAERAEILIDLDDVSVRRVITDKGSKVEVSRGEFSVKKPQTYLTELLGTCSLDPMDLLTLKGKERRQRVLQALPVTVTVEQLKTWWPKCPADYDVSGHGLEVVAGVREAAYRTRTEANRKAKEAHVEATRLAQYAETFGDVAAHPVPELAPLQDAAKVAADEMVALEARAKQAERQGKATESQRARVQELRARAATARLQVGERTPQPEWEAILLDVEASAKRVAALEAQLREAEQACDAAKDRLAKAETINAAFDKALSEADDLNIKADELETALAQAAVEPVTDEEVDNAQGRAKYAADELRMAVAHHELVRKATVAQEAADKATAIADQAKADAARLDAIVQALTEDAPAALLAACDGIPGLGLDGDDVLLDGVRLDALCGAEQVRFCVEVARRANSKSKILVVDGLERLDPEQLDVFVTAATRDDFQLIATRVDRGDIVIEAIQPDVKEEAA